MPANALYQTLVKENIIGSQGLIQFSLNNISVDIKDVSVVGNILQEWLGYFMQDKNIYYREKINTQEFPDFLLDPHDNNMQNLLEVKAFTGSPNFDVANFSAYARSLREHAYRLDAKYLIFKYSPSDQGIIIDNIWLKNVWEICSPSARSPIKIQWKQGVPFNIRPATWHSERATYKPFKTKQDFLKSLSLVIGMAGIDQSIQNNWLKVVSDNYFHHTGKQI